MCTEDDVLLYCIMAKSVEYSEIHGNRFRKAARMQLHKNNLCVYTKIDKLARVHLHFQIGQRK